MGLCILSKICQIFSQVVDFNPPVGKQSPSILYLKMFRKSFVLFVVLIFYFLFQLFLPYVISRWYSSNDSVKNRDLWRKSLPSSAVPLSLYLFSCLTLSFLWPGYPPFPLLGLGSLLFTVDRMFGYWGTTYSAAEWREEVD